VWVSGLGQIDPAPVFQAIVVFNKHSIKVDCMKYNCACVRSANLSLLIETGETLIFNQIQDVKMQKNDNKKQPILLNNF